MSQTFGALVLVAFAIILAEIRRLGLTKDLLVGTFRSFVQLMLVGYVIKFVFDLKGVHFQVLLLLIMATIGAYTAKGRVKGMPRAFLISFLSISIGATITLGMMIALGLIDTSPKFLIPLGGMIIGNAMNVTALSLERLQAEIRDKRSIVEGLLALGLPPKVATQDLVKKAARSAMIPPINTLKIVGLIQLPGAMVGMLIAGAPPVEAAKLQLMVVYMLAASNTLAVVFASFFAYRAFFAKSAQLLEVFS